MFNKVTKTLTLVVFSAALSAAALAQASNGTTAASAASVPAKAAAPTGPAPTKVAVISIQPVIGNTNEFRRDFEVLAKKFEPKSTELKGLQDEIENLKKQLNAQQDKLNETERATRVRTIEQKQKNFDRLAEDARNEFQGEQDQLIQRIGQKVMDIVDKYAKQNNFAVVVDVSSQQGPVLWASEQINISQPVLDAYNTASGVPAPPANAPSATPKPTTPQAPKKPAPTTPGTTPR